MASFVATYAGPVLVLLLVLLALSGNLLSSNPAVVLGQAAGIALMVSARMAFGRQSFNLGAQPAEGPLLRRGPYCVIRHPMYAGALLVFLTSALGHRTLVGGTIAVLAFVLILRRIQVEENLLGSRYPEYLQYASETKRIIPFLY